MELEKKRGISISSTVLQFDYMGYKINLLDTPGHEDFSEDTYRVLTAVDSAQAEPYLWPIGHDVRPASQALGAKGCQDCHSEKAAIFFGNVAVDSPLAADRATPWKMNRFEKKLDVATQVAPDELPRRADEVLRRLAVRPWLCGFRSRECVR